MHEVEVAAVGDPVPHRVRAGLRHGVPAHVRHLQLDLQPPDRPGEDAQALLPAVLFGRVHENLHAHADAEKRSPIRDVALDRLDQAQIVQAPHDLAGRADARQDERARLADLPRRAGDPRATAQRGEGAHDVRQVPSAVVDDDKIEH